MLTLYLIALPLFAAADGEVDAEPVAAPSRERWFTLRNVILFAVFCGLAGMLFPNLGIEPLLTPSIAIVCGTVAAAGVQYLTQRFADQGSDGVPDAAAVEGARDTTDRTMWRSR